MESVHGLWLWDLMGWKLRLNNVCDSEAVTLVRDSRMMATSISSTGMKNAIRERKTRIRS